MTKSRLQLGSHGEHVGVELRGKRRRVIEEPADRALRQRERAGVGEAVDGKKLDVVPLSAQPGHLGRGDRERPFGEPFSDGARDEDRGPELLRHRLDPARSVHVVADDREPAERWMADIADDGVAEVHPDPDPDPDAEGARELLVQPVNRLHHPERSPYRSTADPGGICVVKSEKPADLVSNVMADDAAIEEDRIPEGLEEAVENMDDVECAVRIRESGEIAHVAEQDCQLTFRTGLSTDRFGPKLARCRLAEHDPFQRDVPARGCLTRQPDRRVPAAGLREFRLAPCRCRQVRCAVQNPDPASRAATVAAAFMPVGDLMGDRYVEQSCVQTAGLDRHAGASVPN